MPSYRLPKPYKTRVQSVGMAAVKAAKGNKGKGAPGIFTESIAEVGFEGITLELPAGTCQQNQKLTLKFETIGLDNEIRFTAKAEVMGLRFDPLNKSTETVEFRWLDLDPVIWMKYRELGTGLQSVVMRAFSAIKGTTEALDPDEDDGEDGT